MKGSKCYPKECYKSWFHYLLRIPSPRKMLAWSHKRNAVYLKDKGLEVWVIDSKTNGERCGRYDGGKNNTKYSYIKY